MASELEKLMDEAIALAQKSDSGVYENPRVGAIYCREGKVLGRGYHHKFGEAHAEVMAAQGVTDLRGSTLIVTLEPCSHLGKTPPCVEFILAKGIKRVIYGLDDPNPKVKGSNILRKAGVQVEQLDRPGLLSLTEAFTKNLLKSKCYLTLKWAMTLDGRMASSTGDSKWVSSEESRARVHQLRRQVDGIMIGAGTLVADQPSLNLHGLVGPCPRPIIWDPKGKSLNERGWWEEKMSSGFSPLLITTSQNAQLEWPHGLQVEVMENLAQLDSKLFSWGFRHILVEGGAGLHGALMDQDLGDRVFIYMAPKILGGAQALSPVGGLGKTFMSEAKNILKLQIRPSGQDQELEGFLKIYHPSHSP